MRKKNRGHPWCLEHDLDFSQKTVQYLGLSWWACKHIHLCSDAGGYVFSKGSFFVGYDFLISDWKTWQNSFRQELGVTIPSEKYLNHIRLTLYLFFIFFFLRTVIYIKMTGHLVPVLCLPNVNPPLLGSNPSYCW